MNANELAACVVASEDIQKNISQEKYDRNLENSVKDMLRYRETEWKTLANLGRPFTYRCLPQVVDYRGYTDCLGRYVVPKEIRAQLKKEGFNIFVLKIPRAQPTSDMPMRIFRGHIVCISWGPKKQTRDFVKAIKDKELRRPYYYNYDMSYFDFLENQPEFVFYKKKPWDIKGEAQVEQIMQRRRERSFSQRILRLFGKNE